MEDLIETVTYVSLIALYAFLIFFLGEKFRNVALFDNTSKKYIRKHIASKYIPNVSKYNQDSY